VGRRLQLGKESRGKQTLLCTPPEIIPVKVNTERDQEEQIALFVFNRLQQLSTPIDNCFYDSFGRGTLGHEFAKLCGAKCPIPLHSGDQATLRPVRFDLYVEERDGSSLSDQRW